MFPVCCYFSFKTNSSMQNLYLKNVHFIKEIIYISGSFHKTQYTVLCWFIKYMYHRREKTAIELLEPHFLSLSNFPLYSSSVKIQLSLSSMAQAPDLESYLH